MRPSSPPPGSREQRVQQLEAELAELRATSPASPTDDQTALILLEHSADVYVALDAKGRFTYLNAAAERWLGKPRQQLLGMELWSTFPEPVGYGFWQEFRQKDAVSQPAPTPVYFPALNAWYRVEAVRLPGDGLMIHCTDANEQQSLVQDHERLLAERLTGQYTDHPALRELSERLGAIVQASPLPIVVLTPSGEITLWNPAAEAVFGWTAQEVLGQYLPFIPAEKLEEHRAMRQRDLTGEGFVGREIRRRRKDGQMMDLSVSTAPIRDASGRVTGIVSVYQDITERKQVEEAVARQAEELARSNADLQQFAYVTSHDLQEPLRTIASFSQLLTKRYAHQLGQDAEEFLNYINSGAHRMSKLIQDLLTYSRAVNQESAPFSMVPLTAALDWAVANLQLAIESSAAQIECGPLPTVWGDQVRLVQLFQNLLSNAIKYRRPEVPLVVRIEAELRPNGMVVRVADNGMGFDPQYATRIFGVFKRLHGREISGTGIGLAICQKIVERHGGTIWAESKAGSGATFLFTLPNREPTA